jgi:SRSO17 transposase
MESKLAQIEELMNECEVVPKELEACLKHLKEFMKPFVKRLPREELRQHGEDFIRGLLSDLERKSIEPIAERSGQYRRTLQRFVGSSPWDHKGLIDELCKQVAQSLGSPQGILVLDGSSFPKKGTNSVGVARQWCGRLGKLENCQVGVFLGYVSNEGHSLVDERLYLPKEWTKDKKRRTLCHVPESVKFKTVHELSLQMIEQRTKQLPHAWICGDDEFGRPAWFRQRLRKEGERYVLEIACNTRVCAAQNPPKTGGMGQPRKSPFLRVDRWKDTMAKNQWIRIPIRDGIKGTLIVLAACARVRTRLEKKRRGPEEWLIITRTESKVPEVRYYLSNASPDISLKEMVHAANARHWIEDCFQRAKGEVGLHHYEVRSWIGWHHHITLCLLALYFLVLEQKRLIKKTPAITFQQSAHAVEEILRNPQINLRQLACKITRRLQRTEEARINHWQRFQQPPPTWTKMRLMHVAH